MFARHVGPTRQLIHSKFDDEQRSIKCVGSVIVKRRDHLHKLLNQAVGDRPLSKAVRNRVQKDHQAAFLAQRLKALQHRVEKEHIPLCSTYAQSVTKS